MKIATPENEQKFENIIEMLIEKVGEEALNPCYTVHDIIKFIEEHQLADTLDFPEGSFDAFKQAVKQGYYTYELEPVTAPGTLEALLNNPKLDKGSWNIRTDMDTFKEEVKKHHA